MDRTAGPRFTARLAVLVLLAPVFAGCSGGDFRVDLDLWHAGYAWAYDETLRETIEVRGEAPDALDADLQDGERQENRTVRIEIFNSTAGSVEGIPIYVAAVQTLGTPAAEPDEEGPEPEESWQVDVYTADFNLVQPTYVEWRNQEVQLSGDQGGVADDEDSAANDTENQPENEQRLLDWPLTKNKRWRHAERVADLEVDGVFDGRVLGKATQSTPAGRFEVVRLSGKLEPHDTQEFADSIAESLESQGGEVDRISFQYTVQFDYSYSQKVMNFVNFRQTTKVSLSAEGKDGDGKSFDFTFTNSRIVERKLATYQLDAGVEKPLTFALEVERGQYAPKPITPASHLAVEILASTQGINWAGEEKVTFGVRIYNSTAGEKRLRAADATFPHVSTQFDAEYDHNYLEVEWRLDSVDRRNQLHEFQTVVADSLTLTASSFPTQGWKQVRATLRLKDAQNTTDPTIFTDFVAFEVYFHSNLTYTRSTQNVSGPEPRVSFMVEPTASRVTLKAVVRDVPADLQCTIGGSAGDCLRINDASNRNVVDQRSPRMEFETTALGNYQFGAWSATYSPSAPGNVVVFEVVVRYRAGV